MIQKTITAILVALTLGATAASAQDITDDRKVYPASFCVPERPTDIVQQGGSFSYNWTGVTYYGGYQYGPRWFACPVINDAIKAGWTNALVQVRGIGVRCGGVASPWGSNAAFVTPVRRSVSVNLSTLDVTGPFLEDTDLGLTNNPLTNIFAHYEIACELPSGGAIARYYVRQ